MNTLIKRLQAYFFHDYTASALRVLIILWALFVIVLVLCIDNKWILAGILAYEVLP